MRFQAALEWATTSAILAVAGVLVVLWLFRMERITQDLAVQTLIGLGGVIVLAAFAGSCRRISTIMVASRLDRASGLSDRIGTAVEFAPRVAKAEGEPGEHPET